MKDFHCDDIFSCRKCGQCCEGQGGIVVGPDDLLRLAAALALSPEETTARYGEYNGGKLKIRNGNDGRCIFFRDGEGCAVHDGKPAVCRAWPFFRGNIEDPASLALAKDYCPGIASGVQHETFAQAGRAYLREQGLCAHDASCEANALIVT